MACSWYDPATYASCAGDIAKSVAGDAFASIARSFAHAAQAATTWLWDQINAATAVHLGGDGFTSMVAIVAAIAGVVALALFVIQVITSLLRREPGGLGRAIRGLVVAFLAGGAAVAVVNLLLSATDALSAGVVQVAVGTDPAGLGRLVLGSAATAALVGMVSGPGGAAGVLLLALAILAAVVIVYVALVIRKVLIVVTAVFAPLAFAGSIADVTVSWTRRWIELTLALVFSKLILVLIFVVGYFMLVRGVGRAGSGTTQELTQLVSGAIVLALAGFAPWLALKVVHFTGDHAHQLHAIGASALGGAMAAGRMGQKAAPMAQRFSSVLPGAGGDQASPTPAGTPGPSGSPPPGSPPPSPGPPPPGAGDPAPTGPGDPPANGSGAAAGTPPAGSRPDATWPPPRPGATAAATAPVDRPASAPGAGRPQADAPLVAASGRPVHRPVRPPEEGPR